MAERTVNTSRLRNGYVLTAHIEVPLNGQIIKIPQTFWIRARSKEPNFLDRQLRCEDPSLNVHNFPVISILEGRHEGLIFDGVFSPRELNLVDPRRMRAALGQQKAGLI